MAHHALTRTPFSRRIVAALSLVAVAALLAAVVVAPAIGKTGTKVTVVKTAQNAELDKTILIQAKGKGLTLYTLSSEKKGKLNCKGDCLGNWPPLMIKKGQIPTGAKNLGVVKRPEGFLQVTWKGFPVYWFAGDKKKGEANGEGLKDVGVWHVIPVAAAKAQAPSGSEPAEGVAQDPIPVPAPGYVY